MFAIALRIVSVFLLFFLETGTCMAASSTGNNQAIRVISTQKNGGHSKTFVFDPSEDGPASDSRNQRNIPSPVAIRNKVESAIRSTFLPSGYPIRTPPGYLKYSIWSWIQDFSTQLRSVLATQRVLEGVGVGREGATALSAVMNYLVRDGCGMAASLLFTSAASSRFRTDVKRWRIFADLMVDLGITLEVTAVLVPRALFLPMISVGNMCKAMCGVAAGACGGSINLHWAKGSDISDINAKFGAQHTATGALGLMFAALFARSVDHVKSLHLWTLYTSLTILHIIANMQCMRIIAFDYCNTARMNLLLREFFQCWPQPSQKEFLVPPVLSIPAKAAKSEPLFFGGTGKYRKGPSDVHIAFGVTFNEFWEQSGKSWTQFNECVHNKDNYLISSGGKKHGGHPCVVVSFLSNVTPLQETKAYFHANLLGVELQKLTENPDEASRVEAETEAKKQLESAWEIFQKSCKLAGWDLSKTELRTKGYEVEFAT